MTAPPIPFTGASAAQKIARDMVGIRRTFNMADRRLHGFHGIAPPCRTAEGRLITIRFAIHGTAGFPAMKLRPATRHIQFEPQHDPGTGVCPDRRLNYGIDPAEIIFSGGKEPAVYAVSPYSHILHEEPLKRHPRSGKITQAGIRLLIGIARSDGNSHAGHNFTVMANCRRPVMHDNFKFGILLLQRRRNVPLETLCQSQFPPEIRAVTGKQRRAPAGNLHPAVGINDFPRLEILRNLFLRQRGVIKGNTPDVSVEKRHASSAIPLTAADLNGTVTDGKTPGTAGPAGGDFSVDIGCDLSLVECSRHMIPSKRLRLHAFFQGDKFSSVFSGPQLVMVTQNPLPDFRIRIDKGEIRYHIIKLKGKVHVHSSPVPLENDPAVSIVADKLKRSRHHAARRDPCFHGKLFSAEFFLRKPEPRQIFRQVAGMIRFAVCRTKFKNRLQSRTQKNKGRQDKYRSDFHSVHNPFFSLFQK